LGRCALLALDDTVVVRADTADEDALIRAQSPIGDRQQTVGQRERLTVERKTDRRLSRALTRSRPGRRYAGTRNQLDMRDTSRGRSIHEKLEMRYACEYRRERYRTQLADR
jgi:hypothetical protein